MSTLFDLKIQIKKCQKCPLYKGARKAVPGEGDPKSKILFVGEAPGFREDLEGRPFCGAAGQFLDELLASIKLPRKNVFITNIVKHRPPGNRDPEPDEIKACEKYLKAQIEIIQPKIIVTLGRHSKNYFLPRSGPISQIHGKIFKKNDKILLPLYHPAAGLHQANLTEVIKKDFQIIQSINKKLLNG